MSVNGGYPAPTAHVRNEARCGRCPRCHPGRQCGGDENCRVEACTCHRGGNS